MTKRSMRAARMVAAVGMCMCMAAGMVACDGAEGADGAGEQAVEEASAEDGSSDGSADSAPDGGEAASDAASAGEGEGSQQEGSSDQGGSSAGSDSGSSASAGSSDAGSSQNAGASPASAAPAAQGSAPAASAPAHAHSYTIPVTTQVWHDDVYESKTVCGLCGGSGDAAHAKTHYANGEIPYSKVVTTLVSAGYYETVTTGYKCSCGAVR